MYTLFNTPYALDTRVRFKPTFTRIKDHVKANLERVTSHYKANAYTVPSDHLLVQLIQTLPTESDVPLNRLVSLVEDYIADISRTFQLPSAHHRGRSQYPGVFLGETGHESILLTDERFSPGRRCAFSTPPIATSACLTLTGGNSSPTTLKGTASSPLTSRCWSVNTTCGEPVSYVVTRPSQGPPCIS